MYDFQIKEVADKIAFRLSCIYWAIIFLIIVEVINIWR